MADAFQNPASLKEQIEDAEKGIRAGFIAALFSMAMTLLITILGATGTIDLGFVVDWLMLIDVAIIGACAIGIWFKSRTAATIMFIYFLLSKIIQFSAGEFSGIVMSLVFLFFYGRAMYCSYRYHNLVKKGAAATDVF